MAGSRQVRRLRKWSEFEPPTARLEIGRDTAAPGHDYTGTRPLHRDTAAAPGHGYTGTRLLHRGARHAAVSKPETS
jgi:hypothetical protein